MAGVAPTHKETKPSGSAARGDVGSKRFIAKFGGSALCVEGASGGNQKI